MLKTFVVAIFAFFMVDSIALASTAEKWVCSRDGLTRTVRLVAPAKGAAPCKVFYSKRPANDPNDVQTEADQDDGTIKPTYYSNGNGEFCVRKMNTLIDDKRDHTWTCTKV